MNGVSKTFFLLEKLEHRLSPVMLLIANKYELLIKEKRGRERRGG